MPIALNAGGMECLQCNWGSSDLKADLCCSFQSLIQQGTTPKNCCPGADLAAPCYSQK